MLKYILLLLFLLSFTIDLFLQSDTGIIPPGAKLEKLFGEGFSTEGPAEAPDGSIYFSDQTFTSESNMQAGYIWKYDPAHGRTVIFRSPSGMANGIKFDLQGRMLVCQGADFGLRCLTRTDMNNGKSEIVAGYYNGKPFNSPNDLALDARGRIYFTDPRYAGHEPVDQPVMGVYRLDTDGKVSLIISDIGMPNGIAVSPDQKSLYVGCFDEGTEEDSTAKIKRSRRMAVLAYDLSGDGSVKFRKTLIDYTPDDGPDGIVLDSKGNLYAAVRNESRPGIYIYNPDGKQIGYIATPEVASNLAFTRYSKTQFLYITAGKSLYRIRVLAKGNFFSSK